ncbi:hypothetical protein B0J17DRAFT_722822 [Rhizoctonia solani]|nr:hypothetical protein B0J17DRAFT_722822 [Rhizoctonia solani]
MSWYKCSLSFALHQLAKSGSDALPQELSSALEDAGSRVFIHESYYNNMYAGIYALNPDPMFVYNGYLHALSNLLKAVSQPVYGYDNAHIYMEIQGHLKSILLISHSRCTSQIPLIMAKDRDWNIFLTDFTQVLKP